MTTSYALVFSPRCEKDEDLAAILGTFPTEEAAREGLLKFLKRTDLTDTLSVYSSPDEYYDGETIICVAAYKFPFLTETEYQDLLGIRHFVCFHKESPPVFGILKTAPETTSGQIRRFDKDKGCW